MVSLSWEQFPCHRQRGRSATSARGAAKSQRVIARTDARTCRAHLATGATVAADRADAGRYVMGCGTVMLPASLAIPEVVAAIPVSTGTSTQAMRR